MHPKKLTVNIYCLLVFGQTLYSQILLQGVVRDNGSEPVENALVELIDQTDASRKFSSYTNQQGQYLVNIEKTGIDDDHYQLPGKFNLFQNYPNPFNSSTVLEYEIEKPAHVSIEIYNVLGQKIKTLFDGFQTNLTGHILWAAIDDYGRGVPAGVYIYSLTSEGNRTNKKMVLVDGHQGNYLPLHLNQSTSIVTNQNTLKKMPSSVYLLRVSSENIETYEQHALEITSNISLDVTVWRTVTDIDGNVYRTVKIGKQWWMAENLKVTHYRNGTVIPCVIDDYEWRDLTTGAYCNCCNEPKFAETYGRLYNWYAVNDSRNIAPAGWHVPNDYEWKQLEMALGMSWSDADQYYSRGTNEGGKMKTKGTIEDDSGLWHSPNEGATNESGFSALPGGYRNTYGTFADNGWYSFLWSSTTSDISNILATSRLLDFMSSTISRADNSRELGLSVRCIRDNTTNGIIYFSDGDIYTMDIDGSNKTNLTLDLVGTKYFSQISLKKGKILFTNVVPDMITYKHQYTTYLMNISGANKIKFNNTYLRPFHPKLSPDGSKIVFDATENIDDIYIMNVDGTEIVNLTDDIDRDWSPKFAQDNENVLYVSEKNDLMDIYNINVKTRFKTKVTNDGTLWSVFYKFSSDKLSLFYTSAKDGQSNIYKINLDGSGEVQLTRTFGNSICDISSNDTKILFYSLYEAGYQIRVMDINGQNEKFITTTKSPANNDYWRPNALFISEENKIIFTGYNEGNDEIYIIDIDGKNLKNLTNNPGDDILESVY